MAITETFRAQAYAPEKIVKRYVAFNPWDGLFRWSEVGDDYYDWRQGTCSRIDLPDDVADAALTASEKWPPFVNWPL